MYRLIDDIGKIYRHEPQPPYEQKNTPLSPALCMNLDTIRKNFGESADLAVRDIKLSGINAAVISIDNMIDKQVLAEGVLSPLFSFSFSSEPDTCFNEIKYKAVHTADIMETDSFEKIEAAVMSGFAVILINGCEKGIAVGIQGYASRSVSQPDSDVVQRGSKEGFVEALRVNMTLIRRRLKNPALKFETMTIGETGRTEIALCYLTDTVSPEILKTLRSRLKKINAKTVLASGYLVPFLEERNDFSFFSGVGVTERPDTVCGKLTEGRIAIMTDGVPSALIVPYLFTEYFQTLDDYSNRAYFATFTRILKYTAFFISVLLPGLFTALGTFDPEMFPTSDTFCL